MNRKKKILKTKILAKKTNKEIFPGLYEMSDGSILNTECEPRVTYNKKGIVNKS